MPDPEISKLYLKIILRWLLVASTLFTLLVLGGFSICSAIFPKVYTATAVLQVRPGLDSDIPYPADKIFDPTHFRAEFEIMRSPEFLLPVIYDLGLDKAWAERVDKSGLDALPPQALLPQDALAYMNKNLKLEVKRGTNIIEITVSIDVPIEAARIANAIADRYKTMRDVEEGQGNRRVEKSPVRIISRAEQPESPIQPGRLDYIVTIVVAAFLSASIASFVEIIFLFSRASNREDQLTASQLPPEARFSPSDG